MIFHNPIIIHEGTLPLGTIIIDVVEERQTNKIETVEMMKAFNICWKSSSMLCIDLDLIWPDA